MQTTKDTKDTKVDPLNSVFLGALGVFVVRVILLVFNCRIREAESRNRHFGMA